MIFFRRARPAGPPIRVHVSIQGLFDGRYASVVETVEVPSGETVAGVIEALRRGGKLDETVYTAVRGVRPPLALLVNGDNVARRRRDRTPLNDDDRITILTPVVGG